jgi:hypothetical protein
MSGGNATSVGSNRDEIRSRLHIAFFHNHFPATTQCGQTPTLDKAFDDIQRDRRARRKLVRLVWGLNLFSKACTLPGAVVLTLALLASTAMVSAEDGMGRSRDRGGIGIGDAIGIGVGIGGLIQQNARPTTEDPDKKKAKRARKDKNDERDRKHAIDKTPPKSAPDEIKFVGKPDQIVHDPRHRDGKLGDLNDHKQVIVTKDDSLFTRHYYYRRDGKLLTWYWYDEPVSDKRPDIATLKEVPNCDRENDDDCDRPSGKLPPYVVEIQDKKTGTAVKEKKKLIPTSCTISLQYADNDKEDPNNTSYGTNGDIAGAANAIAAGPPQGKLKSVSSKDDINKVIASFPNDGVCCSSLDIVGHGWTDGSLKLPKKIDNATELPDELGGASIKAGDNLDYFNEFIASLKKALCPDGKPKITFHTCWSAEQKTTGGDNIAEQVNAKGFATAGYTQQCKFPREEVTDDKGNKKTLYGVPKPETPERYKEDSKLKEFPAPEPKSK